jgi:hypothetical protein
MKAGLAAERYLARHIEPGLPSPPRGLPPWRQVLVIPACDESPQLLQRLASSLCSPNRTLVILVLNRPDSYVSTDCNQPLRMAVHQLGHRNETNRTIRTLNESTDIFLYDLEQEKGPTPDVQGVGLARKVGCDIAFYWRLHGHILSNWICSSDADATLPRDYFQRLSPLSEKTVAAVFPFSHQTGNNLPAGRATALYELRLHHYVLGLAYAGSPYAYHTLGSCIAIKQDCYAQVRGFPKRSGGEDFYLLNKAAKTGDVARLDGGCISLESRVSQRVPFGTGPAVAKILHSGEFAQQPLFYHPECFEALRACLLAVPELKSAQTRDLNSILAELSLPPPLATASSNALMNMGLMKAIDHCRRQGKTEAQFLRQFHQWFDGFRTLKFIHALRDTQWSDQSLGDLAALSPSLWPEPADSQQNVQLLREAIYRHWNWTN